MVLDILAILNFSQICSPLLLLIYHPFQRDGQNYSAVQLEKRNCDVWWHQWNILSCLTSD